jgi:hypothetical protein
MPRLGPGEITRLLESWSCAWKDALNELEPIIHHELRTLAADQRTPFFGIAANPMRQILDPLQRRIVELRFFVGLTAEQIGEMLGISIAQVVLHYELRPAVLERAERP